MKHPLANDGSEGSKATPKLAKICFLTSVHHPFDTRVFHREARSLENRRFGVTLLAPSDQKTILADNIKIVGFSVPRSRPRRFLATWLLLISAIKEKADIYHFHDPELIPIGILLHLVTKKPIIYDVHEHYPDSIRITNWLPFWARKSVATLFDWFERSTANFFAAIITADDEVTKRFQKARWQDSNNQVVTLYNFPRADFNETQIGPMPQRSHAVQLIHVGSISRERGQWLLLDVVRLLVDEKHLDVGLWMIGRFDSEKERQKFLEVVEYDRLLSGRVICPGFISQEHLGGWLSAADVGLVPLQPVPKFYKNIPTKMFEYMAAGLPIVGSDLPPISMFINAANAGYLAVPDDPRSHAEKIFLLIQNPDLSNQKGRNGRVAFSTRFNWESEEEKLLSLYRRLLNLQLPGNSFE